MATGEELYESEVLWPEAHHDAPASAPARSSSSVAPSSKAPSRRISSGKHQPCPTASRPVDIPRAARLSRGRVDQQDDEEDDDGGCGTTMVPPHVTVSRRRTSEGAAAFSLRSGPGRARRDLSLLRDSVLRMTGFIEG